MSQSGLDNYPEPGDSFHVRVYSGGTDTQFGFFFAVQDSSGSDSYEVRYEPNQDDFLIAIVEGGSITILEANNTVSTAYPGGEWWGIEVDWGTDGSIDARLLDASDSVLVSLNTNDSTHGAGGIGFRAYQGGTAGGIWFDLAEII